MVFSAVVAGVLAIAFLLYSRFSRPSVAVTTAEVGPVVQAFYSTGTVQPEREFPIKSNTAGILTDVKVDKGARVKRGDVLAIVSDPALQYALDKAVAEHTEKAARADEKTSPVLKEFDSRIVASNQMVEIAKREAKRQEDARAMNASSQSDLDTALDRLQRIWSEQQALIAQREAKKLELQREADVAKAAVATAQWNVDQQHLKAPIDGVVLDRPTSIGTRVAVNDQIMRVADVEPKNLVMRAAVDEEDVTKVIPGQTVRMSLYAFEGAVLSGKVSRIYDQADSERRTFEVDVLFDNPGDTLQPGMTGELVFILAEKASAVVVPAQAVQKGSDGEAILVVKDQTITRVKPQIGLRGVERAEIISGVSAGDLVVLTALKDIADGTRVRVTEKLDPKVAAGLNKPAVEADAFKGFQ